LSATIAALASLVTAAAVFVTAWRTGRQVKNAADELAVKTEERAAVVASKLEVIRIDVNSNLTQALERIKKLEAALGIAEGEDPPVK